MPVFDCLRNSRVLTEVTIYPSPLSITFETNTTFNTDIKSSDFIEHEFKLDGWARWDMPSDDYYDTLLFPEDYTGYDGAEIWKFIHDRIGFHDTGALGK